MGTHTLRWLESTLRTGARADGTWIALRGGSMEPLLSDGDWIRVEPAGNRPAALGEVVVFRRGARLVTHRLVSVSQGIAVTRGDARSSSDPPVPVAALLGRVVEVRRRSSAFGLRRRIRRVIARLRRGE